MVCEEMDTVYEEKVINGTTIIFFLAGAVIGSLATFYLTRKKMRKEKDSEIADVADYYEHKISGMEINVELPGEEEDHPRDDLPPEDKPYPITQQEYVEEMDFHKDTVVYYEKDDILTDMFDREMFIDDTVGRDVLSHFGDDEDDTAYARNEKLGTDYEVILEHKSFASVVGEVEGE